MQCKQNEVNTTTDSNVVAHPKPRLDHSEVPDVLARQTLSLTHDQPEPASNGPQSQSDYEQGKDKGVMYYSLVKQAANDPTLLNVEQLEGVACTVCYTAAQSIGHAEPVAVLCLEIALASNGAFLEALSKSCCELFEKREELMGTLEVTTHLLLRWTPYVTFLAELLALFELWYSSGANAAAADVCGGEMLSGCWKKAVQSLAILLSSCFHVILRPPSLGSFDEDQQPRTATPGGETGSCNEGSESYEHHKLLVGHFREDRPTPLMAAAWIQHWALLLGAYRYKIEYKPGPNNQNVDALSRLLLETPEEAVQERPEYVHSLLPFDNMHLSSLVLQQMTSKD
ncbi:uncharacterized protein LOC119444429 [Dermacentor silvarum]|uniref:uncharacterized protein LOC119444429 n=1 Tax=Dermacentor silvarum TaxID=543639 RepID=UPI00189BE39B|nr:uncharacterized protein LOC119444429 [Dermacentor silvarum]